MQSLFWVCLLSECTFNLKYQVVRDLFSSKNKLTFYSTDSHLLKVDTTDI